MSAPEAKTREYKLMLRPDLFGATNEEIADAGNKLRLDLKQAVEGFVGGLEPAFEKPKKPREVRFYDTSDHLLDGKSYICRVKRKRGGENDKLTVKFRHRDRYISRARDMNPEQRKGEKFEEDIKRRFDVLYSFSSKLTVEGAVRLDTIADLATFYPGLRRELEDEHLELTLETVSGFEAEESVFEGPVMKLDSGSGPALESTCALVVWRDPRRLERGPLVVEFSFRYEQEGFTRTPAEQALRVFEALQDDPELAAWLDPKQLSKTRYVYTLGENS